METWADKALQRIEEDRQNEIIAQRALIAREELRKSQGPLLWNQIRDGVKSNCLDFNTKAGVLLLVIENTKASEIEVRSSVSGRSRIVRARFDRNRMAVTWGNGEGQGASLTLKACNSGRVFFSDEYGESSVKSIVEQMLNSVVSPDRR